MFIVICTKNDRFDRRNNTESLAPKRKYKGLEQYANVMISNWTALSSIFQIQCLRCPRAAKKMKMMLCTTIFQQGTMLIVYLGHGKDLVRKLEKG
jgi:hypothetical protein